MRVSHGNSHVTHLPDNYRYLARTNFATLVPPDFVYHVTMCGHGVARSGVQTIC